MNDHTTKTLSRGPSEGHDGEADSSPNSSLELEDAPPDLALTELESGALSKQLSFRSRDEAETFLTLTRR